MHNRWALQLLSIFCHFLLFQKRFFIDFLVLETENYKQQYPVFEGFFEIQTSLENFLDILSPWYGYLKCSTRVGEHVEQKIRAVRHLNQKLWTKTKKCRQKKSYEGWYCILLQRWARCLSMWMEPRRNELRLLIFGVQIGKSEEMW